MVQVATIRKESADVCRLVIDLTIAGTVLPTLNPGEGANYQWLNTETVTGFQTPVVTAGPGLWSSAPLPTFPLPTDPSPVTVKSATVVDSNTAFQLFIQSGTAGNVYTVSTTIQDSVGRFVTLEVAVIIAGTPAVVATPIATVPPGALPLLGGTMLGPLYLFESPLTGTEAATKAYVDASIANGFTTSNISATGTLLVAGATTLHALAATSGTFSSTLAVTGATTLTGGVAGNMLATGNVSAGGTLGVTGATTLASLGVTSNTTVGGTLGVTGATSLAGLSTSGNVTIGGTLTVNGAGITIALTNGIIGTTANTAATAGSVGELITSQVLVGSTVTLDNNTPADITSISLTAGDWDVDGNVVLNPGSGTVLIQVIGWISTTSATLPTLPNQGAEAIWAGSVTTQAIALSVGRIHVGLNSTTTVYLSIMASWSTTQPGGYGYIRARRVR